MGESGTERQIIGCTSPWPWLSWQFLSFWQVAAAEVYRSALKVLPPPLPSPEPQAPAVAPTRADRPPPAVLPARVELQVQAAPPARVEPQVPGAPPAQVEPQVPGAPPVRVEPRPAVELRELVAEIPVQETPGQETPEIRAIRSPREPLSPTFRQHPETGRAGPRWHPVIPTAIPLLARVFPGP
jgi:hypothetical protein